MKKTKLPFLLLILLVVAAGGAYLVWVDIPAPSQPQEQVLDHAEYIK